MFAHTFRMERNQTETTNGMYGEHYRLKGTKKIHVQPVLQPILHHIDEKREEYLENLKHLTSIHNNWKGVEFCENWFKRHNIPYECFHVPAQKEKGESVNVPPIIVASWIPSRHKKTVCVYCHLDVPCTDKEEWATDPFQLIAKDNKLFGAGTASGKGPLLCWLQLIQSFLETDTEAPVNIVFIIESMHYRNSFGLDHFLHKEKMNLFFNIDCVVVNESHWLGDNRASLVHGCVGMAHFQLFIEKANDSEADLKMDMENISKEMCNDKNEVLIEGFHKNVAEVTPDEEDLYDNLVDFDTAALRPTLPEHMQNFNQRNILMHFWRFPSIWIGPIEECTCDKKDFTKIKQDFILKIVPNQILEEIQVLTMKYVEKIVKKLKINNHVTCNPVLECSTRPWITSFTSKLYTAARRALIQIYHEEPNVIREDRSRVLLNILEKRLEVPILLLPLTGKSSNIGEPNENLAMVHYHEGMKVLAAFLYQYSST